MTRVNEEIWGKPGEHLWFGLPVKPVVDSAVKRAEETGEDLSFLFPVLNTYGSRNMILQAAVAADPDGSPIRREEHNGRIYWFPIESDWWIEDLTTSQRDDAPGLTPEESVLQPEPPSLAHPAPSMWRLPPRTPVWRRLYCKSRGGHSLSDGACRWCGVLSLESIIRGTSTGREA
jgi:hypothetical protein